MKCGSIVVCLLLGLGCCTTVFGQATDQQLERWLQRFPDADTDGDGQLSLAEAEAFRQKLSAPSRGSDRRRGAPRGFAVNSGWLAERFPDEAVCYRTPDEIAELYGSIASHAKPTDGSLRIIGTGHSFMAPGYKTLPTIAQAAGFRQQALFTHTGGGITGSARYKWEQENGIFEFEGNPRPKLLASISNAEWDVMTWGPYFNDHPAYYACWIEFCLKYQPEMKFYLSDAWPQLYQLERVPASEDGLTADIIARMGREKHVVYERIIRQLNREYGERVFVLPTSDAMVLAAEYYHRGQLPGVEGIHTLVGKKARSLWRDHLGHLGPGFGQLEGYVFFATLYGRSPELIEGAVDFGHSDEYPSQALDRVFRKIAWQATIKNPLTGVRDQNNNGIDDAREAL